MLDWAASQTLSNGLLNVTHATIGGDWDYYDTARSGVVTKFNAVYAYSLQQVIPMLSAAGMNTTLYMETLTKLKKAIDGHLWSNDRKAYFLSNNDNDGLAQDANALAIFAHVPQGNHTKSDVLRTPARELSVPNGALTFSNSTTGSTQKISPYASSYHLRAAFESGDQASASYLLIHLWQLMAEQSNANYSGCFWEVLSVDGTPGFRDGTSLCHAWSSGPTSKLITHVLGVQHRLPGSKTWSVEPQMLALGWAKGHQATPFGDIVVEWQVDDNGLRYVIVSSPAGTEGTVVLPDTSRQNTANLTTITLLNGRMTGDTTFEVLGGEEFEIRQTSSYRGRDACVGRLRLMWLPSYWC